jgi:hypothetical protein
LTGASAAPVEVGLTCGAADTRADVPLKPDPARFGAVMQDLQALGMANAAARRGLHEANDALS